MDFKDSKTKNNLIAAFAGESQARTRYTYYSDVARNEGYRLIEEIFIETAENEMWHAKLFFDHLVENMNDTVVNVNWNFPVALGDTAFNLNAAAAGEHEEWSDMYPSMAKIAEDEGFKNVANTFKLVSAVEVKHEERYLKLLKQVKDGTFFIRKEKVKWKCRICGHIHEGNEAPSVCPCCKHKKEFFELFAENY